jgi:hypothetical protein
MQERQVLRIVPENASLNELAPVLLIRHDFSPLAGQSVDTKSLDSAKYAAICFVRFCYLAVGWGPAASVCPLKIGQRDSL